jgi:hypothetical protein
MLFLLNRKRMTAHECLLHAWLTGDHSNRTNVISSSRYTNMRDKIRAKYSDWDKFVLPIGRLAEYSSLRKLLVDKYRIYDSSFGKIYSLVLTLQGKCIVAAHLFRMTTTVQVRGFKLSNIVEICSIFIGAKCFLMLITNKLGSFPNS